MRKISFLICFVLALALVTRWTFAVVSFGDNPERVLNILEGDSRSYETPAREYYLTGNLMEQDQPMSNRTPVYPMFIALHYNIFGRNLLALMFSQIVISVGTIGLVYLIAKKIWNPIVGILASSIFALDPLSFMFSHLVMTETLFSFVMTFMVFSGINLFHNLTQKRWFPLVGFSLGLATLIRPISYYLIVPVVLVIFIGLRKKYSPRKLTMSIFILLLPLFMLVGGWHMRNYIIISSLEYSNEESTMLRNKAAMTLAYRDQISRLEATEKLPPNLTRFGYVRIMVSNPLSAAEAYVRGIGSFLFGIGQGTFAPYANIPIKPTEYIRNLHHLSWDQIIQPWVFNFDATVRFLYYSILYLCIFYLGMLYYMGKGAQLWSWHTTDLMESVRIQHVFIGGILVYFILVVGEAGYARYRLQIMPLFALYAGCGWFWIYQKVVPLFYFQRKNKL